MSGMGLEGLWWVRRAWGCCRGTRVGIQGQRIVWGSMMSMECLIWVWRALVRCGVPVVGVRGFK